jgi:type IV secretion system protein VirD4
MSIMWALLCRGIFALAFAVFTVTSAAIGVQYPVPAVVVGAVALWRKPRRVLMDGSSHGTARIASMSEVEGMLGNRGLILGRLGICQRPTLLQGVRAVLSPNVRADIAVGMCMAAFFNSRSMKQRLLRVRDGVHLNTVAPAGRGKTVSVLGPNLLSYPGSCVVFDPAGELFALSAAHRASTFGHKLIRLDPYGKCGPGGDAYNVLDQLRAEAADLVELCRDLGDQLVVRKGTEPEPHWSDAACNMIGSFLFLICLCEANPADRTLQALREILSSKDKFERAIWVLQQHEGGSTLRRLGDSAAWVQDRERDSVMSVVQRNTLWMDTPLVAACMGRSTFNPQVLRRGRATIYLVLPHDKLSIMQSLIRVWIGSLLRMMTQDGGTEKNPVVFFLDESAMLGQMRILEEACTQYRKFGVKLWFFWQSLDQMKVCFGERANIILGNMDTQQYFGINDNDTAEAISKRIGTTTITTYSENRTKGRSRPIGQVGPHAEAGTQSESTSITTSEQARRLVLPEQVLVWPEHSSFLFHKNLPVIPAELVVHYADPEFTQGRTGRKHDVGVIAGVGAMFMLMFSIFFASYASSFVPSSLMHPAALWMASGQYVKNLMPAHEVRPRPFQYTRPSRSKAPATVRMPQARQPRELILRQAEEPSRGIQPGVFQLPATKPLPGKVPDQPAAPGKAPERHRGGDWTPLSSGSPRVAIRGLVGVISAS